jgi:diguanylate cyclase (GGDEF)-like protein/PAS domain S-box-containing protein
MQQTLLEYKAILENASVGILFTRDRRVLHCNPKFSEIFGWSHGELVGQPGSVFYLSPEDYAEIGRIASTLLTRGIQFDRELKMCRKDGSAVYCRMRAKAINPNNTAEGTIWIAEDIGERKREQAERQDLLLKQQAILENASVGIMFTQHGLIVHCNPRAEAILGWPAGQLSGQTAKVFFRSTEDYERFGNVVGQRLTAGELIDFEWLNTRKDGSLCWYRHLAKAIPTADGTQSTIWISEDISEKKAAGEALVRAHQELEQRVLERTSELEQARQQLETVIQSSPLAIYTRNIDSVITSWNPAAEMMFGWKAEEIIGQSVLPTIPLDKRAQAEELRHRVQNGEAIVQLEFERQRRDGTPIDISMTVAPLRDSTEKISGYLTIAADITDRKTAEKKVAYLAYHDPLTGLPNRLLLQDRLEQAMAHADRTRSRVALMFLDLDNFKQINDTLGHAAGDALLQEVSSRLRECVRDTDTISRQGGDEFVIVLRDLPDTDAAVPVLAKIMERLQDPIVVEDHELSTSVSIGVTIYPEDGADVETLSKKADMAMYRAKEAGRNTYRFFNDEMSAEAIDHLVMRNGLRRALERGEFVLHYQPLIDLSSETVIGAEALIRWNHPELGLVPPARFIPIAEDTGLIVPIGEWVMQEACRQAMAWNKAGHPGMTVAVNLSAVQFKRGNVEQTVIHALAQSGLDPALLELELTESILIQNVEQVLATVKRLKLLGVKLSIDDFGTGYSSLSYLKRFDIDKLKIDQSFIRDLATDPDDAAIVRAIIQMARSLNLKTIAEGVENSDMPEQLRIFQCDEAQGYHFARPMPADEFASYLSRMHTL